MQVNTIDAQRDYQPPRPQGGASNLTQGDDFSYSLSPARRQGSGNFPIPADSSVARFAIDSVVDTFSTFLSRTPCLLYKHLKKLSAALHLVFNLVYLALQSLWHIQPNRNAADRFEPGYNAEPSLIIDSGVAYQSARQHCRIETPDSSVASFGA